MSLVSQWQCQLRMLWKLMILMKGFQERHWHQVQTKGHHVVNHLRMMTIWKIRARKHLQSFLAKLQYHLSLTR